MGMDGCVTLRKSSSFEKCKAKQDAWKLIEQVSFQVNAAAKYNKQ